MPFVLVAASFTAVRPYFERTIQGNVPSNRETIMRDGRKSTILKMATLRPFGSKVTATALATGRYREAVAHGHSVQKQFVLP